MQKNIQQHIYTKRNYHVDHLSLKWN